MNDIYPLRLEGIPKETIWGGSKINELFGDGSSTKMGESWILSARENEDGIILNGKFKGRTLKSYLKEFMPDLLPFPILIKFIDAHDKLSVQVHPDDEIAQKLGDDTVGKTEMWHIIEAEDGATIVYGVKDGIDTDSLRHAVEERRVEEVLNYVPVKAGDTFFIPAGLVHAIGKGILLAEVQQNSDTTYRFYDYGRLGADGKPRQLHIEKALQAYKPLSDTEIESQRFEIADSDNDALAVCKYFRTYRKKVNGSMDVTHDGSDFCSIVCLSGKGRIVYSEGEEAVSAGDSWFVPSALGKISVMGDAELLISFS